MNPFLLHLISAPRQYKTKKKISQIESPRRLVVGESYPMDGWMVSNYEVFAKNFIDVTKKFAESSSISNIYADNVIEHLDASSGELFLQNAFEALVPGGSIRLVTPDCLAISKAYIAHDLQKVSDVRTEMSQHNLKIDEPIDLLHVTFCAFGHDRGRIYDENTLTALLKKVGFNQVERFSTSTSNTPIYRNMEKRVGDSSKWSQLCLEAVK